MIDDDIRCESQGHDWEDCLFAIVHANQQCKWCGLLRGRLEGEAAPSLRGANLPSPEPEGRES